MKTNKIVIFADAQVGLSVIQFMLTNHPSDLIAVVVNGQNQKFAQTILELAGHIPVFSFKKGNENDLKLFLESRHMDYIILAWWPYILKEPIINLPEIGVINFHPSLLPYNRGKHYNFWNLVEDCPFGVTLHFVNRGIDSGDIIFQKEISKDWEDNGATLYHKAQQAMIELFKESYLALINTDYKRTKQDLSQGSFHYAKELEPASEIVLDQKYTAREIINLLRARTFEPYPGCYFYDEGNKYEVRIKISKIKN